MATFTHMPPCHRKRALKCFKVEAHALIGYFSVQSFDYGATSLASQTLYRLVPSRTEGSGNSCIHFWCSWNALISVWDFCLKPDVGRITLRV